MNCPRKFSVPRQIRAAGFVLACAVLLRGTETAAIKWHPGHYILAGGGAIRDEWISEPHFRGIQRMYTWSRLEPERDRYDFSSIREDLARLQKENKQLVLQLQYKAFGPDGRAVPRYLSGPEFGGGVYRASSGSWNPVIWNDHVAERFDALFRALGREFDRHPNLEAIVLPETAPSAQLERVPQEGVDPYTVPKYVAALKRDMRGLRRAFPHTAVIQYTNFPPAALPELTQYMIEIGVGDGRARCISATDRSLRSGQRCLPAVCRTCGQGAARSGGAIARLFGGKLEPHDGFQQGQGPCQRSRVVGG